MSRTHTALGGAVVTALCLTSVASSSASPPDDRPLCGSQPKAAGGVPLTLAQWAEGAQLFGGLGDFHRPISTNSQSAQAYFDQGMRLLWAFNHDEATRSSAKAAELDPQCAMCYWGVSLTVGPNYNLPMMAQPRAAVAWEALQQAEKHAGSAAPVEQALIDALAQRYHGPQPLDTSNEGPVLVAYAQAMKTVAERFPDDADVQTMTAEAMMNIHAWKLWTLDGAPAPETEGIVAILEGVLAKEPRHPGANHYYIHAVEASPDPGKAIAAAERLPGMMPATLDDSAGLNRIKDVLAVAVLVARAGIALAQSKEDEAIGTLREAAAKEDRLAYSEPADWFFPVRHILGAALIKAGRGAEAETVYQDDLTRHPNNGWPLFGLAQALRMQGRAAEAETSRQQFDTAWKNADVSLAASAF